MKLFVSEVLGSLPAASWSAMQDQRNLGSYLSCSVYNLCRKVLVLVANDLAEGVLNGWIVAIYKVAVDELNRQTRLAYSACQTALTCN